jgi:hypothetical protein
MSGQSDDKIDYVELTEVAWKLAEAARDYAKSAGRPLAPEEYWEPIFSKHPDVDIARTKAQGGNPLSRVFLKSPYGLQYRLDHKDWLPFRHGEVDFSKWKDHEY